ncbi:DNA polymerase subunit Cdc27-domain-containing protein [Schizophyllum fasciatum]
MASDSKAADYITKQLYTQKNIVTYRSLSRALGIHVNAAKNELARYHSTGATQPTVPVATYLVSGAIARAPKDVYDDTMDVDIPEDRDDDGFSDSDADDAEELAMILAREEDLEDVKTQFVRVHAVHVYSLSPAPIRDAGLLTTPTTDIVRKIDAEKDHAFAELVGRIISQAVKDAPPIKIAPTAAPGKAKANARAAPGLKPKLKAKEEDKAGDKSADNAKLADKSKKSSDDKAAADKTKPKPSGKIEFKKRSEEKKKEEDKQKEEDKKEKEEKPKKVNFFAAGAGKKAAAPGLKKGGAPALKKLNDAAPRTTAAKEEEEGEEAEDKQAQSSKAGAGDAQRGTKRKSNAMRISDDEDGGAAVGASVTRVGPPRGSRKLKDKVEEAQARSERAKGSKAKKDTEDTKDAKATKDTKSSKPQGGRLRNRRILDSDEEDDGVTARRKSAVDSDDERKRELEAMMDLDDDDVIRVSRIQKGKARARDTDDEDADDTTPPPRVPDSEPASPPEGGAASEAGDAATDVDAASDSDTDMAHALDKKARKKRKSAKDVPLGRNGLKKRRVMRSRSTVDAKGYMVTEDYSSYESVSEDDEKPGEAEAEKPQPKGKGKGKAKANSDGDDEVGEVEKTGPPKKAKAVAKKDEGKGKESKEGNKTNEEKPKEKLKPKKAPAKGKGQQGKIMNFFGPPKAKS